MARLTKEQQLQKIHAEALREFDNIQSTMCDERTQCLQDRRFYSIAGAQWEGSLSDQFENKPKFEINKIALAIQRIFTEYRNNRIAVNFISKHGLRTDRMADVCAGLFRADEQDSCAEEAYDNGFEEAVGGGFGAWRLRSEYEDPEDDENEKQRIRIEPIFDADSSVFFDLEAKRQDKADAKRCFVITSMTHDAYIETYDDDPSTWPKSVSQTRFDWYTPDVVCVAEYYRVEEVPDSVHTFRALDGSEEKYHKDELTEELLRQLSAIGSVEIRVKRVKRRRVHMYIMSGSRVLEDCGYIAGKCIPIIPVYGKRWFIDNVERCMGHVRLAKDAQRLKNMQMSKLGEISALSSVEKPILTPEQVAGHQLMWSEDNIKNFPYLLINPITGIDGSTQPAGPVAYTRAPNVPPAMAALLQISEQDIRDILGNQEQGDKIVSNISGTAIELVQQRLDMQTFLYMSNMAKAIRRSGEVWLEMAKDIYVEPDRKMKAVGPQGELSSVELLRPIIDEVTGEAVAENDLTNAHLDVAVDVGPSFSSQRAAIVRSFTNMMGVVSDPETQQVLQSLILMNMEGEGLRDAREFFRKRLVKIGVMNPTEDDKAAMQAAAANAEEDPNAVFLKAAADEALAKATRARADVIETVADTELKKAKALATLAEIEVANRDQALKVLQTLVPDDRDVSNDPMTVPTTGTGFEVPPEFAEQITGLPGEVQHEFIERLSNIR